MCPRRVRFAVLLLSIAGSLSLLAIARVSDSTGGRPSSQRPEDPSPARIRLIATGGTIAVHSGGRLSADELVAQLRPLPGTTHIEAEQFSNTSSAALTLDQWLALARRINDLFRRDPALDGIVVTTGTDTLEEIAYFLHLTIRSDRPVVVVGAMRRATAADYDGHHNLRAGLRVAAERASRGRGVLVVLNEQIHAAREVEKTDAVRLDTFQARTGPLGTVVDADRVVYQRALDKRHTAWSEFDISSVKALPRVDIVLVYQGASGDIIRALVDRGAQGIVIASAGAGSTSGTQLEGIRYALARKALVVTSTRMAHGRIPAGGRFAGGNGESRAGVPGIAAEDLPPLKARILLMLALTVTRDPAEIQRIFTEY